MLGRLGCQMSATMLAAFACELLMKAISLTRNDAAPKTHDLNGLYMNLPEDSRRRLEADYKEIAEVIDKGRYVFGRWRYFENNAGREALQGMIDLERTLRLAKTARVLVDEAKYAGLYGSASMDVRESFQRDDGEETRTQHVRLRLKAGESPRRHEEPFDGDDWEIVSRRTGNIEERKLAKQMALSWSAARDEREFNLGVSAGETEPVGAPVDRGKSASIRSTHTEPVPGKATGSLKRGPARTPGR